MISSISANPAVTVSATAAKLREIKNKEYSYLTFTNQAKLEWSAISDGSYHCSKALASVLVLDFNGLLLHIKLAASHLLFATVNPVGFVMPSAGTHFIANIVGIDSIVSSKRKIHKIAILKVAGVVAAGVVTVLAMKYLTSGKSACQPPSRPISTFGLSWIVPTTEEATSAVICMVKVYALFGVIMISGGSVIGVINTVNSAIKKIRQ